LTRLGACGFSLIFYRSRDPDDGHCFAERGNPNYSLDTGKMTQPWATLTLDGVTGDWMTPIAKSLECVA
jgi:hypothetical protein